MNIKKVGFKVAAVLLSVTFALIVCEWTFRLLEPPTVVHGATGYVQHSTLGWLPPMGKATVKTSEYEAVYNVNNFSMNDKPIQNPMTVSRRIMALGDSHTFAVGVSEPETWPNVLEGSLYGSYDQDITVYNMGVVGYSLGQYLQRMRETIDILKPQTILVGFSLATDLYDLIPPRKGGFIYGSEFGRIYFDLDSNQELIERHELIGVKLGTAFAKDSKSVTIENRVKDFMSRFAIYRRFKRSHLAYWIGLRLTPGNRSFIPGLDTALKIKLDEEDLYRWNLADKILGQMASEAKNKNAIVVLVNIPYVPQIYDEIWNMSFGSMPNKYDRWIASDRLRSICEKHGIRFVDTSKALYAYSKSNNRWLHFRHDGHPTKEGHKIIANTVAHFLTTQDLISPISEPTAQ